MAKGGFPGPAWAENKKGSPDSPRFFSPSQINPQFFFSGPFVSGFGASFKLDYYEVSDIEAIIKRSAALLGMDIDAGAILVIAKAARFTPRAANRLLKRVRDYAEVNNLKKVDEQSARATLEMLEIDDLGLEPTDRQLLRIVIEKFHGGPVGIQTLAAAFHNHQGII